ncbi:SDR family oxidoreductase [Sulfuriflexus mobilis]|uniref:SDR family oxidoreductase n=1 Tax=Sulfuriflexus mobilis TaxID=1811807 RepID=UPI000F832A6B|nr:SDR family oxidoreductase [Sulfuriflexus mobilis]
MQNVVIIGCGDIGQRVAHRWQAQKAHVAGLSRNPATCEALQGAGITPLCADLDEPASLGGLSAKGALVYYFAPPPREGQKDTRLRNWLASLAKTSLPQRVVLISTTAVYGDSGGDWVTEQSPLQPGTDRGRRRLDAEMALRDWSGQTGVPVVILRVPGIYGPGRLPRARLEKGLPVLNETESGYTNRIHSEDLATICVAAAERGQPGAVYNISDGHPGTMTEWFNAVADHLGLSRPPQISLTEAETQVSAGMLGYLKESRRISNRKMIEELGVELAYTDLRLGLGASD